MDKNSITNLELRNDCSNTLFLGGIASSIPREIASIPIREGAWCISEATDFISVDCEERLDIIKNITNYPGIYKLLTCNYEDAKVSLMNRRNELANGVYIFGAYKVGASLARECRRKGVHVLGFIDNDSSLHGQLVEGLPVFSPHKDHLVGKTVVVASGRYTNEICNTLDAEGCSLFNMHELQYLLDLGHQAEGRFRSFFSNLFSEKLKFISAFLALDDEQSRKVYDGLISMRLCMSTRHVDDFKSPFSMEYLDDMFVQAGDLDVYIDVGAYNGDTLDRLETVLGYSKQAYLFEVEAQPYLDSMNKYKNRPEVHLLNFGLSDKLGKRAYSGQYSFDLHGNQQVLTTCIQVLPLDLLNLSEISLIKIDVEGSEGVVIAGARNTIKKARPKLAICAYHRASDYWKLISDVKAVCPDYKVGIRHYSDILDDTTLYFY
jgi:FkbM family methyltransferase